MIRTCALALLAPAAGPAAQAVESTCFGTVSNGRLEDSVQLPTRGPNYSVYRALASTLGRTYVHSKMRDIVVAAYAALEKSAPDNVFVYGETGWPSGGRIRPHRTHRNGLSVDFFVPVRDRTGGSVPLPTNALNRFGYDIDFDEHGRFEDLTIDLDALAEHLYQLHQAASQRGAAIALVILDPPYLPKLFATTRDRIHALRASPLAPRARSVYAAEPSTPTASRYPAATTRCLDHCSSV